jgi:hypothetical protein
MSGGFGPFRPVVVQRAGWYFKPVLVRMAARSPARDDIRAGHRKIAPPVKVQPAGWYFKPVRVNLATTNRSSRNMQRMPLAGQEYVRTKAVIPTNTVAPVASGTPQNGQNLSTTNGTWTGTATVTVGSGYQWQTATNAGFTTAVLDIGGATASTYLLTAAEIGLYVRCIVQSVNVAAIGLGYSNVLGPVTA